ncbi:MAG: cytochrome b5 domain-containing protein [Candidatus Aenigmatarchaeota archaeon]|nr:MAG: cytochrome b5 domain-containing protein [Candidatus Aenigmarchaeota archaeon]
MSRPYAAIILLLIPALFVSGCTQGGTLASVTSGDVVTTHTMDEVAIHDTPEDCWIVIEGKVYEVTAWIPAHPGGQAIVQGCGADATELFETKPGSRAPHSPDAMNLLETYYIGNLE